MANFYQRINILSTEMDVLRGSARKLKMERIKMNIRYKGNNGGEREAGHHIHYRKEKTTMVWPIQKYARE
jgi:hypothetical protein